MKHLHLSFMFQKQVQANKEKNTLQRAISRLTIRIEQLQNSDNRTLTATHSAGLLPHWTTESHKAPMWIAPKTLQRDLPEAAPNSDHTRRDYIYTLRHTDFDSNEPIPLIHWLVAQRDIYNKLLATHNSKKRPSSAQSQATSKRPTGQQPVASSSMISLFMQQQQQNFQFQQAMMQHLAPQPDTGLMDPNWTAAAPPGQPMAIREPTDLRNFIEVQRVATAQQTPHGQPASAPAHRVRFAATDPQVHTTARGRGRNRRRPNNSAARTRNPRRNNNNNNTPDPGQGHTPE